MGEMGFDEIESALLGFLKNEIFDPGMEIRADTHLIAAGLDSFSLLRLLVFIEKTFGMRIPEAEINEDRMFSVKTIAGLIDELLQTT
ncbi:MAG: phosphopantetheine-binding protein [Desulfosalsimonas sp.]|uniref:phosphopantetheine-binding protein n=1 Tax=Desulfosalsimonas sp. TaxID=3073848 RepID=UPI003970E4E4